MLTIQNYSKIVDYNMLIESIVVKSAIEFQDEYAFMFLIKNENKIEALMKRNLSEDGYGYPITFLSNIGITEAIIPKTWVNNRTTFLITIEMLINNLGI